MTAQSKLTVLKFGSSVLRSEEDLPRAVHEIYRHWRRGERVLVVVSAFGDTTDRLFSHADSYYGPPEPSALAALLATGEATTAALLSLALDRAGLPVRVLAPEQAGLLTCGERLDAELIAVNILRLNDELRRAVVVLPGFVGRDETGGTTLLGRGGSDFTALYLAHQLGGHCVLVKDVDGFYTEDPMRAGACADRYESVSWETAYRVGGALVQPKAIRFAEARGLHFTIAAAGAHIGTEVGPGPDRLAPPRNAAAPLNVALIGCGTVGGGVYQRLAALPEFFNVTGVATRNPDRAVNAGVPAHLLTNDSATLIAQPCDVIVELIGGTEVASELLTDALRLGRHRLVKFLLTIFAVVHYQDTEQAAIVLQLSVAQVETYVHKFLCYGVRGVAFTPPAGRRPKLTPTQQQELAHLLEAGPPACGFSGACWR